MGWRRTTVRNKRCLQIKNELFKNIERTADVIHGNTTLAAEKGHAYGEYNYDVSQYLAGWILGIEWDPDMVIETNKNMLIKLHLRENISKRRTPVHLKFG